MNMQNLRQRIVVWFPFDQERNSYSFHYGDVWTAHKWDIREDINLKLHEWLDGYKDGGIFSSMKVFL